MCLTNRACVVSYTRTSQYVIAYLAVKNIACRHIGLTLRVGQMRRVSPNFGYKKMTSLIMTGAVYLKEGVKGLSCIGYLSVSSST